MLVSSVPSAPGCPRPACARHDGAPAIVPRHTVDAASCGSAPRPLATAAVPNDDTQTAGAPRQGPQPGTRRSIVLTNGPVADRRPICPQHPARPTLAHRVVLTQVRHGLSPRGGRHHLSPATSFSIALSGIASASSFFSRAFSASSVRSRRASDTSSPPNLAFLW